MAETCDWPGCVAAAEDKFPILRGMTLTIAGQPFTRPSFQVCGDHVRSAAELVLGAIGDEIGRRAARANLAPGDAEWNEYFADE